ncbi:MAG: MBL fold metallo-hydrolase [Candidatus Thorarchaeota archaeon]|nr:MAG: MBL fold metallo-hydrolase [Candidatus Thorarchaeota archaeon]
MDHPFHDTVCCGTVSASSLLLPISAHLKETRFGGFLRVFTMRIEVVRSEGLAALSYFVSSEGEAFVVDPRRDASIYASLSAAANATIRYVFETHRNEDYVTGSLEVQDLEPDAEICHSDATSFKFGEHSVADGETFTVGNMRVTCINTPGHTDDSMCYAVADLSVGPDPVVVFTGDTLFVSEVGRTDLVDISKHAEMSHKLYDSLHEKVLKLDDGVIVYPGHGAGSVCGGDIGDREFTTIGIERKHNRWLQMDEDSFVSAKLAQTLTRAQYFKHCERLNTSGPPLLRQVTPPRPIDTSEMRSLLSEVDHRVIDVREPAEFLEGHIPGTVSLSLSNMGLLAGWVLSPDQSFSFVLGNTKDGHAESLELARAYLTRIGFDNVLGYLEGGLHSWTESGGALDSIPVVSVETLKVGVDSGNTLILDVREEHEYVKEHIEGSLSLPLTHIHSVDLGIVERRLVAPLCPSGYRSTTATSLLRQRASVGAVVFLEGLKGWRLRGYPVVQGA